MKLQLPTRNGAGVLGLGVAACVACCVGPILAFLGGLGVAGIVSSWFIGGSGFVIAVVAAFAFVAVRSRRARSASAARAAEPVPVQLVDKADLAMPPASWTAHDSPSYLPRPGARTDTRDPVNPMPLHNDAAPIACTASGAELPARIDQVERLRTHLRTVDRTADGVVLRFPRTADIEAEIAMFTVEEKACCAFWGFAVTIIDDAVQLQWDGPPAVAGIFDDLVRFFESDEPLIAFERLV